MTDLLTLDDLAKRLGCSKRTACYLVYGDKKRGMEPEIPSFKLGGLRRVDPADVEAYVRRSRQASET